jgi:hypothetical protein
MRAIRLSCLMLAAVVCLLLSPAGQVCAQAETHNFITYDTTFNFSGDVWNAIITRPANLFTAGSPDTASRPLIIMMPGQGQMGSASFSLLTQYGPHYWLANGWDGSVQLGNGKHYPIIISVNHVTNVYPQPFQYYPVLTYILSHYHVNPKAVYGTGLSEGAFTTGGIIEYEQTIGDHAGMKLYTALAIFEGTPTTPTVSFPPTPTPYGSTQWCDTQYYKTWAALYNGRYFYLEGNGSDNFRDGWHYATAMNDTVPNSAFFSYEDLGGGAHCCWNSMYDPSATNWTSVGTLGPNNAPSQLGTNQMGDYSAPENVYQWMMRQGDTTLVGSGAPPPPPTPVVLAGSTQTITLPTNSVTLSGSATETGGTIASYLWTEVSGGAATIGSSASASTGVTGLVSGTYVFRLLATDNLGDTASSTVKVIVNAAPLPVPVVSAGANQNITLPTNSVTLSGSASETGGTIASYLWTEVSGGAATIGTATSAGTAVTGLAAGTYVFKLLATDNLGDTASSTVQVIVNAAPPPPTPVVLAGSTQTITLPTNSVTLSGSASETGGTIAAYLWTEVSGGVATIGTAAAASTSVTGLAAGTYIFKLLATDNLGDTASSTVKVIVNAAPPPPVPVVNAGANQNITLPTNSVTLSGSASETGGTIAAYLWTEVSGGAATIGSSASASTSVTGLVAGTYVFRLLATDNLGDTSSTTVQVVVNGAVVVTPSPCKAYYWDSANITIALTNANYPNIKPCDTIYVDACKPQAGYRSLSIKLSSATPWVYSTLDSNRINLIFRGGYIQPSASNLFLNSIDASNNLLIQGLKMYDHTDPLFTSVTATGYLHHIKFVKDTLQNMGGLWGSGPTTTSLPNFTGNNDTTNCNYDIWFHQCVFDSIGNTTYGGMVTMWLGGFNQNQVFVKTEIDNCIFNYSPSPAPSGPACFIHAQQCYFIKIHDNTFTNLGVVANPEGHAASIFMQGSLFNIYHNTFHANFSNCVRAISQGTVPGMNSLFTAWDPTYDGVSRFWGNILDHGRKYPMIEDQKDTIGFSGIPYYQPRRSARIWNNTMFRGGTGTGNSPYNVSLYDWYEVAYTSDTLEMHNNVEVGPPTDTTATMCSAQACVALLTRPSGIIAAYDTSGNEFSQLMTFATSGLADSVYFYPALNGLLYNNGVSVPAWLTTDFYGEPVPTTGRPAFARNTGVDVGAVQENSGSPSPPSANAGPNQTITLPINSVTLTGSGSETNGTIVSYAWTQAGGPSTATLGSAGQAQTTAGGLVQGTYVFLLTVTDNSGKTASATVTIIVKPAVVVVGLPSANAGSNQTITLPTNSVTLTGSGSESNGTIVSYTWTEVSGPSTATFGTAGQASTTAGGLVAGIYRFQLTITDALGVSASATVQVTVNPAAVVPGAPSANAGSDQTITLPTNSVTLTGSGTETNGTIVSYAWTQVSGPSTATISAAGNAVTGISGLVQGVYKFQLTVTDNSGVTATDVVTVTVNPAVVAPGTPVANAGANQTITLPTNSVTLAGSGSETNGTIVSYAWTQVSGPSTATLGTAGQATTTAGALIAGVYRFQLTITDGSGVTASATVQVIVNPAPVVPGAPSANAGADQTITLPTNSVTLTGSGTETNGTIVSYAWTQVSGPSTATISAAGSAQTGISGLVQGVYKFQLTVTDNSGVTATDVAMVTVNPAAVAPPQPPVAIAGPAQTVAAGTVVNLDGSASYDTGGSIVAYDWVQVSGFGGVTITNSNTATPNLYGLTPGTYVFQLTVTGSGGGTASATVTITVTAASTGSGLTPVAVPGNDTTIIYPGQTTVTLNGSGSYETGGSITAYNWIQVSGPSVSVVVNKSGAITAVSQLIVGDYIFQLTVTDANGDTATADVKVHVQSDLRHSGYTISLYPNPVSAGQVLNVQLTAASAGQVSITIYDILGHLLKEVDAETSGGTFVQAVPTTGMGRGVYVLLVRFNGQAASQVFKFVVN